MRILLLLATFILSIQSAPVPSPFLEAIGKYFSSKGAAVGTFVKAHPKNLAAGAVVGGLGSYAVVSSQNKKTQEKNANAMDTARMGGQAAPTSPEDLAAGGESRGQGTHAQASAPVDNTAAMETKSVPQDIEWASEPSAAAPVQSRTGAATQNTDENLILPTTSSAPPTEPSTGRGLLPDNAVAIEDNGDPAGSDLSINSTPDPKSTKGAAANVSKEFWDTEADTLGAEPIQTVHKVAPWKDSTILEGEPAVSDEIQPLKKTSAVDDTTPQQSSDPEVIKTAEPLSGDPLQKEVVEPVKQTVRKPAISPSIPTEEPSQDTGFFHEETSAAKPVAAAPVASPAVRASPVKAPEPIPQETSTIQPLILEPQIM